MRILKSTFPLIMVCLIFFAYSGFYSEASFIDSIHFYNEIDMSGLSLTVSDTYTENRCIIQADANENGDYATMTCYFAYAQDKNKDRAYSRKKFVDIFNNQGDFICELIFYSEKSPSLRMVENRVFIFFTDTVLVFDIDKKDIKYCSFNPSSINYPDEAIDRGTEFESGKWKYKLSESQALGYRQLTRFSGNESQILIDIPKEFDHGLILTVVCVGWAILSILLRKVRKKKATNCKTGVGSMF